MAWPLTAAITGVRNSNAAGAIGDALNWSSGASKRPVGCVKSAPAQNVSPAPLSTIARTSSSSSQRRYASPRSAPI